MTADRLFQLLYDTGEKGFRLEGADGSWLGFETRSDLQFALATLGEGQIRSLLRVWEKRLREEKLRKAPLMVLRIGVYLLPIVLFAVAASSSGPDVEVGMMLYMAVVVLILAVELGTSMIQRRHRVETAEAETLVAWLKRQLEPPL